MQWPTPPAMTIDVNKQYTATVKTNYGDIVIDLLPKSAPMTVNNFVFLARQGFFDKTKIHRVVRGFVIQMGDPKGDGTGGPGYRFADEPVVGEYVTGAVAMANSGANTNGSQVFICLGDLRRILAKSYNLFGQVRNDQATAATIQKISNVPVKLGGDGQMSSPTVDVHIDTVTIEEK
jgi:cyclophilin family peptidyl-prolyl cis-trans isomerase